MTFFDIAIPMIATSLAGVAVLYARHSAALRERVRVQDKRPVNRR